jgi:hypothetical protein
VYGIAQLRSGRRSDTYCHEKTKKFMDNHLTFIQPSDDGKEYKVEFIVEFIRKSDISVNSLLDGVPLVKKTMAKIVGANPTYVRILGDVKLTITEKGKEDIVISDEALWE